MSKKNKNVFDKQIEALQTIVEELQTLNSYLYGIGVELDALNISLKESFEYLKEKGLTWRAK